MYSSEKMMCNKCGKEMRLDDVDYNFKGNQDNYWVCDECQVSCYEKIRYGKSIRREYSDMREGDK